jgi:hypothetical protein
VLSARGTELALYGRHGESARGTRDVGLTHLQLIVDYQRVGACRRAQRAAEQRKRRRDADICPAFVVHGPPAIVPVFVGSKILQRRSGRSLPRLRSADLSVPKLGIMQICDAVPAAETVF